MFVLKIFVLKQIASIILLRKLFQDAYKKQNSSEFIVFITRSKIFLNHTCIKHMIFLMNCKEENFDFNFLFNLRSEFILFYKFQLVF